MKTYTVIGVYADGQIYCTDAEGRDAHEAMRAVARDGSDDLEILGAIEGAHTLIAACEDAGASAHAADLVEDDEVQP